MNRELWETQGILVDDGELWEKMELWERTENCGEEH